MPVVSFTVVHRTAAHLSCCSSMTACSDFTHSGANMQSYFFTETVLPRWLVIVGCCLVLYHEARFETLTQIYWETSGMCHSVLLSLQMLCVQTCFYSLRAGFVEKWCCLHATKQNAMVTCFLMTCSCMSGACKSLHLCCANISIWHGCAILWTCASIAPSTFHKTLLICHQICMISSIFAMWLPSLSL